MIAPEYKFYLLCTAEFCVVVAGFASIPAATGLQILILPAIFRDLITPKNAYYPLVFLGSFTIATVIFTGFALSFPHTSLPLFSLVVIAAFAVFYLIFTESRLEQKFGGSP
jgi:hypothetical protein